jgi:hypothetical protein
VSARDDELAEGRGRQLVEGDLRLPGRALGHQRTDALLQLGRELVGRLRLAADDSHEPFGERPRVARPRAEMRVQALNQAVDVRVAARHAEGRRLADRQREDRLRPSGSDQHPDHAAVGMAHQMGAVLEQRRQLLRLLLEVDSLQRRVGRIAPAVGRDERVTPLQRPQRTPGRLGVSAAPVDQQDAHQPIVP